MLLENNIQRGMLRGRVENLKTLINVTDLEMGHLNKQQEINCTKTQLNLTPFLRT